MKKIIAVVSLSVISGLGVIPSAVADPSSVNVEYTCPTTQGNNQHTLRNSGFRIAGYGTSVVNGSPAFNDPFFIFDLVGGNIYPAKISAANYVSDSTDYDSTTGIVSCHYSSVSAPPFAVSYVTTNGIGGIIVSQTANTITVDLPTALQ